MTIILIHSLSDQVIIRFFLIFQACCPVAVGKTRATQLEKNEAHYNSEDHGHRLGDKVACIQVHGDAAIAGQVEKEKQLTER